MRVRRVGISMTIYVRHGGDESGRRAPLYAGLALALGLGFAAASGHGVAWADSDGAGARGGSVSHSDPGTDPGGSAGPGRSPARSAPSTPRNQIQRQVRPAPTGAAGHRRTVPRKPRQPALTLRRPRTPPARASMAPHLRPQPSRRWQRRPPLHHASRLLPSTNRLWSRRRQGGAHIERPQLHRGMLRRPRHRCTPPS